MIWYPRTHHPPLQALARRVDRVLTVTTSTTTTNPSTHFRAYQPLLVGWIMGADVNDDRSREEIDRDDKTQATDWRNNNETTKQQGRQNDGTTSKQMRREDENDEERMAG
jgi:hypothetical protein